MVFQDILQSVAIGISAFIIGSSLEHLPFSLTKPPVQPAIRSAAETMPPSPLPDFLEASYEEVLEVSKVETHPVKIIDARSPEDFQRGSIPHSINVPAKTLNKTTVLQLPSTTPLIIYCSDANCPDSLKVAQALSASFPNIKLFKAGWQLWDILSPSPSNKL